MNDDNNVQAHLQEHADCSEVLHRIYEYLDGELQPSDVARVAEHLEACGPCLHEHDLDRAVKDAVRRSSSSETCPDSLRLQVVQRITMVRLELDG
ncbi:anti-sigma factor [Knoellia sinensis KCTC 19936]|uniref:Anti-sigma factor n=1 Tax=Knoellia sinensis KCTC 19936 TaxID=1385520 RepID=A0A0A0JCP3_9MICO|nr:mycothiol system anti-sigma-R factor [Knoellia sinensis]KGN34928.1 anti-sigma factor [Knoellia sinensis KCTC 19936]